jgi:DNA-binding NtrC family response regulator
MESRISIPSLTPEAIAAMIAYPWPGNVRELKNVLESAPFLTNGAPIGAEHIPRQELLDEDLFPDSEKTDVRDLPRLPWQSDGPHPGLLGFDADRARTSPLRAGLVEKLAAQGVTPALPLVTERDRVLEALRQADGNQTRAASLLGVSRRTLINRLESFGLPRPRKRGE